MRSSTAFECAFSDHDRRQPDRGLGVLRRQGMRVGNCFSRVLDPTRAPLFGDEEGCAPLSDEGWPGDLPADMRVLC